MLSYANLPWQKFAELTVKTLDLDPVYVALANVDWDDAKKLRWSATFFTYYHTGTACDLADLQGDDYWRELWARYDKNPRASERRHFRGDAGKKAIRAWYETYGTPERFVQACLKPTFMETLKAGIPQIGTYFAAKAADFREAVFGCSMDWTGLEHNLVALPKSGAEFLFPGEPAHESIWKVVDAIKHLPAPPRQSRMCGIAEAETVLCMAKSYYRGKLIGSDIKEKVHDLAGYGANAQHLLAYMPPDPKDSEFPL